MQWSYSYVIKINYKNHFKGNVFVKHKGSKPIADDILNFIERKEKYLRDKISYIDTIVKISGWKPYPGRIQH